MNEINKINNIVKKVIKKKSYLKIIFILSLKTEKHQEIKI